MARPTDYSEDILDKTNQYLSEWKEFDAVPSIAGLAVYLDLSRDTIYEWLKHPDKQEFSDITSKIATSQERTLINGSLNGVLNANISKLMLSKHGYHEKTETDITTKGQSINEPSEKIKELADKLRDLNEVHEGGDTTGI